MVKVCHEHGEVDCLICQEIKRHMLQRVSEVMTPTNLNNPKFSVVTAVDDLVEELRVLQSPPIISQEGE